MKASKNYKFWFATGSQDLYGDECLAHVAEHSQIIVKALNESGILPYEVVWKPTLITNEVIRRTFNEANTDENCAGVITWCHTFSPAKSWILGLKELRKPLLHLHTQFNREIPYDTIDMDFMNENQAAHGDREFGHIFTRLHKNRKVIMGYWEDKETQERIGDWMRTAVGVIESSHVRVMRVADNMRNVAVTEGDKVEAEIKALKEAAGDKILKVIIETCYLTDDEKVKLCQCVTNAKADYIKTSTGFGTGGATIEDIRLFAQNIGPDVKMKAAGGVKSREDLEIFLEAGCDRIGTSSAVKMLEEN